MQKYAQINYYFEDFTETNYRNLLQIAKSQYDFICYDQYKLDGKNILWRHDVDFSMHRAIRLAKIEAEENVKATYFIHLHNENYNAMELEVAKLIYRIIELGHDIGIHFDPLFYSVTNRSINQLEYYLKMEQEFMEKTFCKRIIVFSFHNPEFGNLLEVRQEKIVGLINTYSEYFQRNYSYCSDSNGYWRFRRLEDVLREAKEDKLQVLTHPEWWVPEPMPPRERITRCIEGRAKNQHNWYDDLMTKMGRENLR